MRKKTRRPRVLIIVENNCVPRDRRVWRECRALTEAGYGVSVVCPNDPGLPRHEVLEGVHLHRYPPAPVVHGKLGFGLEYAYAWVMTAFLTLRVALREGFDAIQACNPPESYFILALPFKALGKRFVFDHHDLTPEMFMVRYDLTDGLILRLLFAMERATFRTADHVISTNDSFRQVAIERGGRRLEDVTIVRNGPELATMRRRAARPELRQGKRHLCCWLGLVGPSTGVDLALHSFHHLVYEIGRRDCLLVVLGYGESLAEYQALARELKLDEWVNFLGWTEDDVWFDYLSTADIGLQPNPKDAKNDRSTAVKTMEYMAFEVPVVAFDLTETRASAGEAAVYARPNDVVDYALAIHRLLDDPERRAAMGALGRQRVEGGLSWDEQRKAYVEVFERLLGPPIGSAAPRSPVGGVTAAPRSG